MNWMFIGLALVWTSGFILGFLVGRWPTLRQLNDITKDDEISWNRERN